MKIGQKRLFAEIRNRVYTYDFFKFVFEPKNLGCKNAFRLRLHLDGLQPNKEFCLTLRVLRSKDVAECLVLMKFKSQGQSHRAYVENMAYRAAERYATEPV